MRRLDFSDHHVRIGHRQRPTAPVARRPRVGASAVRPGAKPRAVEGQHRAATRSHGVDAHHRRAHPHAGNLGLESALELAGKVAHVGRGAAHVEADHAQRGVGVGIGVGVGVGTANQVIARELRGSHHADDAAGRA